VNEYGEELEARCGDRKQRETKQGMACVNGFRAGYSVSETRVALCARRGGRQARVRPSARVLCTFCDGAATPRRRGQRSTATRASKRAVTWRRCRFE
jgi:hypothetical protein